MPKISIESLFLKYPTSLISDALDELYIYGAISGVFPQRYDQGRISGRALPVKFNKNLLIQKLGDLVEVLGNPLSKYSKLCPQEKL